MTVEDRGSDVASRPGRGPDLKPRRQRGSPFNESLEPQGECLVWIAGTSDGYGKLVNPETKKITPAHVYFWELEHGPVPKGYELHHLCRVRPCVLDDHLECLTHLEHAQRHGDEMTHCPAGHEYTPENTYLRTKGNGRKQCRACHREEVRRARQK